MIKIGVPVRYRDGANHLRTGVVDASSIASGRRLWRVSDRWFEGCDLVVIDPAAMS
ncbi:MAG: hypothetical protein K8H74_03635 [Notoacmeibacter sp.]|nr:hypothetical protein [Notoacmeibacter sp.]